MDSRQKKHLANLPAEGVGAVYEYERPRIISYTEEEILDRLGPAQTILSGGTGRLSNV